MDKQQLLQVLEKQANNYSRFHPSTSEMDITIFRAYCSGKSVVQIAMDTPCSESTVYRVLRRVQDFISAQNYDLFLQALRKAIDQDPPNFGDNNAKSTLEMLYMAYAENNEHENAECNAVFLALDAILSDLPVVISNPIFDRVCALCSCHERNGFTEGFKLGVHMANELSA